MWKEGNKVIFGKNTLHSSFRSWLMALEFYKQSVAKVKERDAVVLAAAAATLIASGAKAKL